MIKILFIALLLASCSSQKVLDEVKNEDFDFKVNYSYQEISDTFSRKFFRSDSLKDESLNRFSNKELTKLIDKNDFFLMGSIQCHRDKKSSAFKYFDKIFKKEKGNPVYWNQIGTCYLIDDDFRKAELYYKNSLFVFEKATRSKQKYIPAYNNLAVLYAKRGQLKKASLIFQDIYKNNPDRKTPAFNLAQTYLKYGLANKAIRILGKLYQIDKYDIDILAGLGMGYLYKNNISKSLEFFNNIPKSKLEHDYIGIPFSYALMLTKQDDKIKLGLEILKKVDKPKDKMFLSFYKNLDNWASEQEKALKKRLEKAEKLKEQKQSKK